MDIAFSSVAARVATVQGQSVTYFDADRPGLRFKSSLEQLPYLFAGDYDFTIVKHSTEEEALGKLLTGWNVDRGLRMLQIILDIEEDTDFRSESMSCLESLLAIPGCQTGIENFVCAVAAPLNLNWDSIRAMSIDHKAVQKFINKLANAQPRIREIRRAWLNVSVDLFESDKTRYEFELKAVLEGAFRRLVFESSQFAIFECHKMFANFRHGRQIVTAWTAPLKREDTSIAPDATWTEDPDADEEQISLPLDRGWSNKRLYDNSEQQKAGIKAKLQEGDLGNAERFARELVNWQLEYSGPAYAAKSLCSIAQFAKQYGRYDLQLNWVKWATELAPNDSRAFGQAGDAYLQLWKLDDARAAYEMSKRLGNANFSQIGLAKVIRARGLFEEALEAFSELKKKYGDQQSNSRAWTTYAEILRDLSRFEEALEAYDAARAAYPDEAGVWCGRAAVLGDMGRLKEALAEYDIALMRFPNESVPACGRADILKQMGRLDEALRAYSEAMERFPEVPVTLCGKADVLRAKGDFALAAHEYRTAGERFPFEPVAYSGFAETLRDWGRIEQAAAAYDEAVKKFPFDEHCRNGRANVLKLAGRFEDALQEYERNVRQFPHSLYALSGRAHLLKELGYSERALEAYDGIIARRPDHPGVGPAKAAILGLLGRFAEAERLVSVEAPSSLTEWVAYHVRGMIYLREGKLDAAIGIFRHGVRNTPFFKERKVFESALAACEIKCGRFDRAYKLLDEPYGELGNVLKVHVCSELGKIDEARQILSGANDNVPPPLLSLRNEIAAHYQLTNVPARHSQHWILEKEVELLLEAA